MLAYINEKIMYMSLYSNTFQLNPLEQITITDFINKNNKKELSIHMISEKNNSFVR